MNVVGNLEICVNLLSVFMEIRGEKKREKDEKSLFSLLSLSLAHILFYETERQRERAFADRNQCKISTVEKKERVKERAHFSSSLFFPSSVCAALRSA
jgi:hypothetical protein